MGVFRQVARAGNHDDITIYALADGSRIKIPSLVTDPDPDDINVYFDASRDPAVLRRWNGTAWIDVGGAASGDVHYRHIQSIPDSTWTVVHNLGKHPSVSVVDDVDNIIFGGVHYEDLNTLTIEFAEAIVGEAYCN